MEIKRGIAVSAGVAIGPALVLDNEGVRIPSRFIDKRERKGEVDRLRHALAASAADTRVQQEAVNKKLGKNYGAIFNAHALLIEDPELVKELEKLVNEDRHSAEYAVSRVIRKYAKMLENLPGATFNARTADLFDIEKKILRHLLGTRSEDLSQLTSPVIVLSHDLTPSETAMLDPKMVFAFATEVGGRASHTAIMAGVLEIPAVVGLGRFLTDVSGGDEIIVDGNRGVVILNPDEETREHYEIARKTHGSFAVALNELKDLPAVTKDGFRVEMYGNIEFPQEANHCLQRGAEGVGLYRTEFLYLNKTTAPNEEEHFEAYKSVVQTLAHADRSRSALSDLGADKFLDHVPGGTNGAEPVARPAERPTLSPQPDALQDADAGDSPGQRLRPGADHVPDGQHRARAPAMQDDPRRGEGGPRGRADPVRSEHPGRHDDRGAVRRS